MSSFIDTLLAVNTVVEVRVISGQGVIRHGFFNSRNAIREAITRLGTGAYNFYITVNKFDTDRFKVLNEFVTPRKGGSVCESDVILRTFMFFDFDSNRSLGTQSTDEQLAKTVETARLCREHLAGFGFPQPIIGMSGSGTHLYYLVNIQNNDDAKIIIDILYKLLHSRFNSEEVKFDTSVRNASRITKLLDFDLPVWYPNSDPAIRRRAVCVIPDNLGVVSQLAFLRVGMGDQSSTKTANKMLDRHKPRRSRGNWKTLDIIGLLCSHGMYIEDLGGGRHAVKCPWVGEHTTGGDKTETIVMEAGTGGYATPGFKCMHAHCEHRTISDVANFFDDTDAFCKGERKPAQERKKLADEEDEILGGEKERPNNVAARVLTKRKIMRVILGSTHEYNGVYWEEIDDYRLGQLYAEEEKPEFNTQRRRLEGVNFIKAHTSTRIEKWNNVDLDEIAVTNGVYSVRAAKLREHRMEDYLQCVIPRAVTPDVIDMPCWDACLTDWWGGDADMPEKLSVLQQFFGQVLLPHNAFKKALVLLGDTDTGKSLAIKVMEALVGEKNVTHLSISNMGDDSACSVLTGKLLNTVNDPDKNEHLDDGGFKRLTGGDEIVVNEKYVRRASYRPIASHVIACNTLPRVDDRTDAVFNRLLVLKFNRRLSPAEQNKWLLRDLVPELPAIFNWAIDGARQLLEQGDYSECPSSRMVVKGYKHEQNDAFAFISATAKHDEGMKTITLQEFRMKLSEWLDVPTLRPRTVRDMVRAAGYDVVVEGTLEIVADLSWKDSCGYRDPSGGR